jgi:hypothetical protein
MSTTVTDQQYGMAVRLVDEFLSGHDSIRNRQLRAVSHLSYDQVIQVLGRMCSERRIEKRGSGGGTYYVLPRKDESRDQRGTC